MSESQEIAQLQRRLDRERAARRDAEAIAERSVRELYDRHRELESRHRELVLLEQVSAAANAAETTEQAMRDVLMGVCRHLGWPIGQAWVFDRTQELLTAGPVTVVGDDSRLAQFARLAKSWTFRPGEGLPGRVYKAGSPVVIQDLVADANFPRAPFAAAAGLCAAVAFPVLIDSAPVAVLECFSDSPETPTGGLLRMLRQVGETLARVFERAETAVQLRYDATHDALTGLANRVLFNDRLGQALACAQRDATTIAVALIDLDGFKEVNDTLGHHHGDRLLKVVAVSLAGELRRSDTIARLGGDEFAIILRDVGDAENALAWARRLRATLRAPLSLDGVEVQIEASVGLSLYPVHGADIPTLLRKADVGMYEAKRRHLGEMIYQPHLDPYSATRLGMVAALRHALDRNELVLHYQPKVSVDDPRIVRGVEALARWPHPAQGLISPDEFIPLAERTGLIIPLTAHLLRQAITQASLWRHEGLHIPVAVNITSRSLLDPRFPNEIASLLAEVDLPASLLELEVTESSMLYDPENSLRLLGVLSDMGIAIAIDDFGTGYSSMAQLKQLPLNDLKIDRGFVAAMLSDERDAFIVRSTVALGHDLGLRVVAEGVEDTDTLHQLRAIGCDIAQGFLIQRPGSAEHIGSWLHTQSQALITA